MHFYGWKQGLAGMYYRETKAAADAIKFTLEKTAGITYCKNGGRKTGGDRLLFGRSG